MDTVVGDLNDMWQASLEILRRDLTAAALHTWLDDTQPIGFDNDTVVLAAPHRFAREQLDARYGDALRAALSTAAGRALNELVIVRTDEQPREYAPIAAPSAPTPAPATYVPERQPTVPVSAGTTYRIRVAARYADGAGTLTVTAS